VKLLLILCDKAYEPDVAAFLDQNGMNIYEIIDGAKFSSPSFKRLSTSVWPGKEVIFLAFVNEINEISKSALKELKSQIEKKGISGSLPIRIYIQDVEEI